MKKYFKRPTMIEAVQWTGLNAAEVIKFTGGKARPSKDFVKVFTLFGERIAKVSDYILKDSCGNLSVCDPYEFTKDYEEFEDGIDVSVTRTRQFINEPKATVKRTIANKKVSAVIESQGGLTRLFVNGEEISNVSDLYFTHDAKKENQPVLSYTALVENAFKK